jgi:hypothetical protein
MKRELKRLEKITEKRMKFSLEFRLNLTEPYKKGCIVRDVPCLHTHFYAVSHMRPKYTSQA